MSFDKYINKILSSIEATPKEINEIQIELADYLGEKKEQYLKKGIPNEEAELKTIQDFGNPTSIGKKLSYIFFPQRKWISQMFLIFSILHFLLANLIVLVQSGFSGIVDFGPSFIVWLILTIFTVIINYLFNGKKLLIARHRGVFLIHCLFCLLSVTYILPAVFEISNANFRVLSSIFMLSYILIIIANMVFGVLIKPIHSNFSSLNRSFRLVAITSNTLSGIFIISYVFFIGLATVTFGTGVNPLSFFLTPLVLLIIWAVTILMNNYINKNFCIGVFIQLMITIFVIYRYIIIFY